MKNYFFADVTYIPILIQILFFTSSETPALLWGLWFEQLKIYLTISKYCLIDALHIRNIMNYRVQHLSSCGEDLLKDFF